MLDEGDVQLRDSSFGLLDATNWKIPSEEIEMGQRIATGTYGTVFCGAYRGFTVAIKQLKHESDYNPNKFEEIVLAEAQFLANLQHPNIVKFFGVARERGAEGPGGRTLSTGRSAGYLVVTELCDTALDKVKLGIGNASNEHLWEIIRQVAHGMRFLHKMKTLHRDLKPANIIVVENRMVRQQRPTTRKHSVTSSRGDSGGGVFSSFFRSANGPDGAASGGGSGGNGRNESVMVKRPTWQKNRPPPPDGLRSTGRLRPGIGS